ncbi:MAG: transcriptional repressor [Chloroflexi bacterium]|nr:transcriptional repressor [Chloroflexota bacterium]
MARSAADRLRRAGERVTPQRLLVAATLTEAAHGLTAAEVQQRVRRARHRIGRATVFRALEALVSAGLARRLERDGHVYAYVACEEAHHHHLACDRCGRVEDIGEAHVAPLVREIEREAGFHIDDARVDFYGLCAGCLAAGAG